MFVYSVYVMTLVFLYSGYCIVNQLTKVSLNAPEVGSQLIVACKHRTIELVIAIRIQGSG